MTGFPFHPRDTREGMPDQGDAEGRRFVPVSLTHHSEFELEASRVMARELVKVFFTTFSGEDGPKNAMLLAHSMVVEVLVPFAEWIVETMEEMSVGVAEERATLRRAIWDHFRDM